MECFLLKSHENWLEQYLANCLQANKSPHTILNYRTDISRFIYWLENVQNSQLPKVDSTTIADYKEFLSRGGQVVIKRPTLSRVNFYQKLKSPIVRILKKLSFKIFRRKQPSTTTIEISKSGKILSKTPIQQGTHIQNPLGISSKRRHLSSLKNFFQFLKESHEDHSDLFQINPVKQKLHGIRLKEEDVQNTPLLTIDDWRAIKDWTHRPRERLVAFLLYYGGFRLSELSSLKWEDFNEELGSVKFRRKGGYIHTLFIRHKKDIFHHLSRYSDSLNSNGKFLFPGRGENAITPRAMSNLVSKILIQAKCPSKNLSPHSFRKACATNLYYRTKDLLLVRDYLNHNDAKVTQTYIQRRGNHDILRKSEVEN